MRARTWTVGVVAAVTTAMLFSPGVASASVADSPADLAKAAAGKVDQPVVVVLHDQPSAAPVGSAAATTRAQHIAELQAPVIASIKAHAKSIRGFRTRDVFAATVTAAELVALRANPAVASVIPDTSFKLGGATEGSAETSSSTTGGSAKARSTTTAPGGAAADVCTATPQYDESATAVKAVSDDPSATTARSLGYTGAGVKVAFLAEGIDIHNVNFLRNPADPRSTVFTDYKDFTGDGLAAATSGAEAFLDANAIAGQGKHVYDVDGYGATPIGRPCNVLIQGTAPGAQLVGLKVFDSNSFTTTSAILQAIDYAVQNDHVDVINESFGSNQFPDSATSDAIKQFDDAAVAAGVTVTVSSGDSGPFNTQGSPSTDPKVIAVGASTTFRFYEQSNEGAARALAPGGWENDNISALSSSGVNQAGGTLNVVAPGDLSWASCTASAQYYDCTDDKGDPSDIESSGGTSESAPLTAGTAALVIQAYKNAHGSRPTPALVKHIIVSTASDLGAPAEEQGAGLVNAADAVQLAASIKATPHGDTVLKSDDALAATGLPGSTQQLSVQLTNEGTNTQRLQVTGRTLGTSRTLGTGSVMLADSNPQVVDGLGRTDNVRKVLFDVPAGQTQLSGAIAYQLSSGAVRVPRIAFVDPQGRFAAYSLPQGVGNYGTAEVTKPQAGRWTAYIYSATTADLGTVGNVRYSITSKKAVPFGSVSPSSLTLSPGASQTVTLTVRTPSAPGDLAGALVLSSDRAGDTTLPVTLRTTVDIASGGRYSGALGGGNGRDSAAQQNYYVFDVPSGTHGITANLTLANDPSNVVGLYLIGPHGDAQGYGQSTAGTTSNKSATAWTLDPTPGRWTLAVAFATPVAGDEVSDPFRGSIVLDGARASARGLPTSSTVKLAAGSPVTVPVTVRNNGSTPAEFFVDARTAGSTVLQLADLTGEPSYPVPSSGATPLWFVPSETSRVTAASTATRPIEFDLELSGGDPDVESRSVSGVPSCAKSEVASYSAQDRTVPSGIWFADPSQCGPYGAQVSTATAQFGAAVATRPFDPAVTSTTGDFELIAIGSTADLTPVLVLPGGTATITVTITPRGAPGTTVTGDLYVDTVLDDVAPYDQLAADELVDLPYSYQIK